MRWLAGVDGCRGGWVVALAAVAHQRLVGFRLRLEPTFEQVLVASPRPSILAVDMPIGLPDQRQPGGRACDRAARALLGPRASSVFTPPPRRVLQASTYAQVRSEGVSRQAFGILPKIREVDRHMTPRLQRRVFEAHPELAFARLAGRPMQFNKKTPDGARERLRTITDAAPGLSRRIRALLEKTRAEPSATMAAPDDVLDALVLALTALRIAREQAVRLPPEPPVDRRGLRMEIWY